MLCIKIARQRKAGNVLIFEDDVKFLSTDLQSLSGAVDKLCRIPDWKLFYLGGRLIEQAIPVSSDLIYGRLWTTHSIAVNAAAYDLFDNVEQPIDLWLARVCPGYCINPLLTTQSEGYSDIRKNYVDYIEERHIDSFKQFAPINIDQKDEKKDPGNFSPPSSTECRQPKSNL